MTKFLALLLVPFVVSSVVAGGFGVLRVGSTTSLCDVGFWEEVERFLGDRVKLQVVCGGTGFVLELGKRGEVDLLVVHDPGREEEFVRSGHGLGRFPFAYDYFLLLGPKEDPAGIKGLKPLEAMRRIALRGSTFVSRGDGSGTHFRELALWRKAGFDPQKIRKQRWYVEAGFGMGQTLVLADHKGGYVLSDQATYLAFKGRVRLLPLVEGGEELLNVYSLIPLNPYRHKGVSGAGAEALVRFLTSPEGKRFLRGFKVKEFGRSLLLPYEGR